MRRFFSRAMLKYVVPAIILVLLVSTFAISSQPRFLGGPYVNPAYNPSSQVSSAQSSSNPIAINTNTFPFYTTGLQSMFNTLLNTAPCGSGLTALHEAPSVTYNWWTDDNAKALGALSYIYPNFATQDQEMLSFIQHNDING
ncbi:MAG: hypothetical protein JRN15_05375, partial [Nitrososphaerota archaeon]|nr:hypothetical protein [Nitrososphaerota archaeon]